MIPEIIILAMIAAFLGMRLYSVLGRRAEHEEEIVPNRFEREAERGQDNATPPPAGEAASNERTLAGFPPAIEQGLRDIAGADRRFDLLPFLEGARAAYGMTLEAYWRGDKEELRELVR